MILDKQPIKRYELWQTADGCESTFIAEDNKDARAILSPGAKCIWSCEAHSYVDAMNMLHAHLGWEPYKPPPDDE